MRTIAYVDGYNFYHGRLKHTPYKWLDLRALIESILRVQDPAAELVAVRFFTAMIKGRLARLGSESVNAQEAYHRAIAARGIEIIKGEFAIDKGTAPRRIADQPADRDVRVDIWTLGEKQTDVKLALGIYRDVAAQRCDQVLLCTNDSDLAPALQSIREDFPAIKIGVILPRRPEAHARQSGSLEKLADWTRHHILDSELEASQLPARVGTRKKPAEKPSHW